MPSDRLGLLDLEDLEAFEDFLFLLFWGVNNRIAERLTNHSTIRGWRVQSWESPTPNWVSSFQEYFKLTPWGEYPIRCYTRESTLSQGASQLRVPGAHLKGRGPSWGGSRGPVVGPARSTLS